MRRSYGGRSWPWGWAWRMGIAELAAHVPRTLAPLLLEHLGIPL
jgi:hypothetical protein